MTRKYGIKELSKLTSVTVRTLHYYDAIGLLNPKRTPNGRRMFYEKDLIRLQKIISLKYLGLSLSKIRDILDNDLNLPESFRLQHEIFSHEETRIKKIKNLLSHLMKQCESSDEINWEMTAQFIKIINLRESDKIKWHETFLTKSECDVYSRYAKKRTENWENLFGDIRKYMLSKSSKKNAKILANRCKALTEQAYKDYPELQHKLWKAWSAGILPGVPYDQNVAHFLSQYMED